MPLAPLGCMDISGTKCWTLKGVSLSESVGHGNEIYYMYIFICTDTRYIKPDSSHVLKLLVLETGGISPKTFLSKNVSIYRLITIYLNTCICICTKSVNGIFQGLQWMGDDEVDFSKMDMFGEYQCVKHAFLV